MLFLLGGSVLAGQTAHFSGVLTSVGSGFSEPLHLAVDAGGDLFVSDAENIAIYEVVAVNGVLPPSPTIRTLYRPSANPQGIAVDAQGNVYFTTLDVYGNLGNNSVTELVAVNGVIPSSPVVRQIGSGLEYPENLAVDPFGNIFVSDSVHSLVKEFLAVNGSVPDSPAILTLGSGFSDPQGIAVDGVGNVYVSDSGSKQVEEIVAVNGVIPVSPEIVSLAGGFCAPSDIALDSSGDLFVADYCNAAIFELQAANGVIQPLTTAVSVAGGLGGVEGVAVSASGTLYAGVVSSAIPEVIPAKTFFGSVDIGSAASALAQTFVFDSAGALGPISVLTMGAPDGEFTNAGSGTCSTGTTYAAGQSCTVNVSFTPRFAGPRSGAVQLSGADGTPIATAYLQGVGVGPQVNYSAGVQTTLGAGFSYAKGVAVDGSGNLYTIDTINNLGNIEEVTAVNGSIPVDPVIRTLVGGLDCPVGPALDGAGNLFFADVCYHTVSEIQAVNGSIPASPVIRTLTSRFQSPAGIAVDANENVFVLDGSNNTVNEIHAVNGTIPASPTITTVASGFREVDGIAVDASENLYVSDDTNREVFEIHAVSGNIPASPVVTSVGSGFVIPRGITVDGAGNVYVAEYFHNTVYKLLAVNGSVPASPVIQTLGTGLVYADGVAVDGERNVFVSDYGDGRLVRLDYADPPNLTFASTSVGSTSMDSPQTVTVENVGNSVLSFPVPATGENPSLSANFTLDGSTTCPEVTASSSAGTLAAGASCDLGVDFIPTTTGSITGSVVLTDDNLNAANTTQSIGLSGSGTPPGTALTPWMEVNHGAWQQTSTVTIQPGDSVSMGPQQLTGGTYSWSGPGLSATTRVVIVSSSLSPSVYTLTYTNTSGGISTETFTINIGGTTLTPWIQVDNGAWQQTSAVTVHAGDKVSMGPQQLTGGTFSWTGPGGFSASTRVISGVSVSSAVNTFILTYTNTYGAQSQVVFTITVGGTPLTPWIEVNNGPWQQISAVTVHPGDTVSMGPQQLTGGTYSWTGPGGFSASGRVVSGVSLDSASSVYTLTYTNTYGVQSQEVFTVNLGNTPITPWIQVNGGAWQQASTATVTLGSTVNLGPQQLTGGTCSWSGPGGYSASTRIASGVPLSSGTNTFTLTYTNIFGGISTQNFTITAN